MPDASLKMVIDCDPGIGVAGADLDDGIALAFAARSPAVDLLAVTTVSGNVTVDRGTEAAIAVLELMGAGDVPVHQGADRPLVEDAGPWRALLDGWTHDPSVLQLWDGIELLPPPREVAAETPAVRALIDTVLAQPGEVTVLAIGPLTNIAAAMLLEPTFAESVAHIFSMGGAFNLPGALQELNFSYDPEATAIVLGSGARLTVLPLDVSVRSDFTPRDNERLLSSDDPALRKLGELMMPWIRFSARMWGGEGCSLHDPLALALTIQPGLASFTRGRAAVELHGRYTRGRPVFWTAATKPFAAGLDLPDGPEVHLIEAVDDRAFVELLLSHLEAA